MKFYFDMDGVIANFDSMLPDSGKFNHPSESLSDAERAGKTQFWQTVERTPNFWSNMPVIKNSEYMLSVAHDNGEIFILSKTPSAKHFKSGQKYVDFVASEKRKWVLKNLGQFFDKAHIIICDKPKGAFMHPTVNDILVDDRIENINEWEKHGGRAVLYTDAISTAQKIKQR